MRGLIWFREDLRLQDNTALFNAAEKCDEGLIGLYIINPEMWHDHQVADCRVEFILRGLTELSVSLREKNIPLLIMQVDTTESIPGKILSLIQKNEANAVFFNRQYEFNEAKRDNAVRSVLKKNNIACYTYDDQTILPPSSILTQQGASFKVFTPFKRAWYQMLVSQGELCIVAKPKTQKILSIKSSLVPNSIAGFQSNIDPALWPAGEKFAQHRLSDFIKTKVVTYDAHRDFPALNATSQLSPYLSCGMISPRQCFKLALQANDNQLETGNKGPLTWMNELIWRDFYKSILISTPRICMHRAYKLETEKIQWKFNASQLLAWQQGNTGFPIIDAAMRQLNTTGWMHNRLRMITAMFFTKNLFFDWRIGEEYFMRHLIDGDLSANNGGWQWCASTGTDAVPYFRIFNPIRQSERYDPNGDFIRQYCPEFTKRTHKTIHQPSYPLFIDLSESRKQAIAAFKLLKEK